MIIDRCLTKKLKKAQKQFGVISITGPRQSGKTTLVKKIFSDYKYFNLEDFSTLQYIASDPKGFLEHSDEGIIIDEIQRFPELLSYIQVNIDKNFKPGKFVITGSQNLLLSSRVSQSLAGRVAVLVLLPFSIKELENSKFVANDIDKLMLRGFYPAYVAKKLDRDLFFSSYIETYLERDVRMLKNIGNLSNFRRFLSILAGRVGQILNMSSLASDIGINSKTVSDWISILEASFIVFRLQPYYKNYGKRVIKSPKLYFYDTGLLTYLLEIDNVKEITKHYLRGSLFENLVISEIVKYKFNNLSSANFYFWRDKLGREIDFLITNGLEEILLEIKAGKTFNAEFSKTLDFYSGISDSKVRKFVIYDGEDLKWNKGLKVINWQHLQDITKLL